MTKKSSLILAFMIVWAVSCSSNTTPTKINTQQAYPIVELLPTGYPGNDLPSLDSPTEIFDLNNLPEPQSGFSSIAATIQTPIDHKKIVDTAIYLAKALGEDNRTPPPVLSEPSASRGDIIGKTDIGGRIVLLNIPPGNYYMFVWAPYDWRPVQVSEQDQTPKLLELVSNQTQAFGDLYVTWP